MNVFSALVLTIAMHYLCCSLDMLTADLAACFNRPRDFFKEIAK